MLWPTPRSWRTVKHEYLSTAFHHSRIGCRLWLYLQQTASTSWSPIHPLNLFQATCGLWMNSPLVECSLSTCQISIFRWLNASWTLARLSLYLHKQFLIKLKSLFSSKASSPSMIRLNPNDCYLTNTRMLQNIHNPSNPRTVWMELLCNRNPSTSSATRAAPAATEYRLLQQTALDVVLTVDVLQKWTVGTIACHRKHDLSLSSFF